MVKEKAQANSQLLISMSYVLECGAIFTIQMYQIRECFCEQACAMKLPSGS